MVTVGERIKEARKKERMSAEALGKSLYVSKVSVYRWESGQRQPDLETIKKIGNILNVSLSYLTGETEVPPLPPETSAAQDEREGEAADYRHTCPDNIVIERNINGELVKIEIPAGRKHLIKSTLNAVWQSLKKETDAKATRPKREKLHRIIDDLSEDMLDKAVEVLSSMNRQAVPRDSLTQQPTQRVDLFYPVIIGVWVFVQRQYIFRVAVLDLSQSAQFSVEGGLFAHRGGHLIIRSIALSYNHKINLRVGRLSDAYFPAAPTQFQIHGVFEHTANIAAIEPQDSVAQSGVYGVIF
jgi:transcriptional regulator with XRE-family HTH domain